MDYREASAISTLEKSYQHVGQPPLPPALHTQMNRSYENVSMRPIEDIGELDGKPDTAPDFIKAQSSFTDFFSSNYNRIQTPLNWQRVISGGVLMVIGLVLGFFGFYHLRFTLLLTGFVGGGIAAFAILTNTEPDSLWANRILIYVAVCIAAGLLIGIILLGLNKYASWILGGAGGLALGVYILSWKEGGLIHNTVGRIALMAGAAALGMFLSLFLGSLTIIFATVLIVQIPLYILHKRNQRAKIRASVVPPVNRPYGGSYRDSQYGSQWDSQYGSRDHLNAPPHQAPVPEYTWWGKRKNRDSYPNDPYMHGYNEKGYQNLHNQSRSVNNLNQYSNQPGTSVGRDHAVAGSTTETSNAPQPVPLASASTVNGKTVVFEEKKGWFGRTKVVPKFADTTSIGHKPTNQVSTGAAADTAADTIAPTAATTAAPTH
ncbi:hypothetical protein BG011_006352 [Mortierella polycephala]|uniref:TM7S3/TM198-like domain-containing protein n=1 Tax=Mortierella polycephala TaxID=41804 RepID=A0A9P6PWC1_9FUNG|nr:hypothetical protein BG011_006352 [Mortierella polycephala]